VRHLTRELWGAVRRIAITGAALFVLCVVGFIWFAARPAPENESAPTDAIVVLTGGSLRLQSGMDLLRDGKGRKLFVSGVNQHVDLDELLRVSGNARDWAAPCCCWRANTASIWERCSAPSSSDFVRCIPCGRPKPRSDDDLGKRASF